MKPEEMLARLLEKPVALSIRAPWTHFILHETKNIENRTWATKYRGPVFLHQSKRFTIREYCEITREVLKDGLLDADGDTLITKNKRSIMRRCGHIVGMVEVVDCVTTSDSPWFFGPFGFVLANPVAFAVTVPCKGRLGFFKPDCDLPALRLPEVVP